MKPCKRSGIGRGGSHVATRAVLPIVLVVAVAACASDGSKAGSSRTEQAKTCNSAKPTKTGTFAKTYQQGHTQRHYLLTIPKRYNGRTRTPVIINLHGADDTSARQNAMTDMPPAAGRRGYIVVAPDALTSTVKTANVAIDGGLWNIVPSFTEPVASTTTSVAVEANMSQVDDVVFLNGLLDSLERQLCIDPHREYATGMSAGAAMTTWLSCQPKQRFAAVAPVSGVNMPKYCPGNHLPPLVTFHGDADPAMPYTGNTVVGIALGVPTVDTRLNEIAGKEHCSTSPSETDIASDVVHRVWKCPPGSAVELYKIHGGGHAWPGAATAGSLGRATQSINATNLILDFFAKHTAGTRHR